jgi:hypothetical protein
MKCQHQGCQCTEAAVERNGRRYCSDHCAEQQARQRESEASGRGCECGHAECSGVA